MRSAYHSGKGENRMRRGMIWALGCCLLLAAAAGMEAGKRGPALTDAAAKRGVQRMIWVDLDGKQLTVYDGKAVNRTYPIASGASDTPSPIGVFRVSSRFIPEMSGFGTRFLGLNVPWGSYGIHGTNKPESIGRSASHGCIRMRVGDMEALYPLISGGTKVVITGGPYGPLNWGLRNLKEGDRGADVKELQLRLIQRGLLYGGADGVFGPATRRAVVTARKELNLPAGDQADPLLQQRLGMVPFE